MQSKFFFKSKMNYPNLNIQELDLYYYYNLQQFYFRFYHQALVPNIHDNVVCKFF